LARENLSAFSFRECVLFVFVFLIGFVDYVWLIKVKWKGWLVGEKKLVVFFFGSLGDVAITVVEIFNLKSRRCNYEISLKWWNNEIKGF